MLATPRYNLKIQYKGRNGVPGFSLVFEAQSQNLVLFIFIYVLIKLARRTQQTWNRLVFQKKEYQLVSGAKGKV